MKSITIQDQTNNSKFSFYDNYLDTILRAFEGFEYAEVKSSIDDVAGTTGAVYINSKFGRRRLAFTGDIVGTDVFTKRRLLNSVIRQTGVIKLLKFTTYDDLELQCEAEVVKYTNSYNHQVHTFLIEMIAPDYRFYSQALVTHDLEQTLVGGGASIPANIPMDIPLDTGDGATLERILNSVGNESTDPILTVYGPGTNFIVGNQTTGKEFTLDVTLDADDYVEVNVKDRTVIKNGVTNLYPDFEGDFWTIEPGENELKFLVDSGTDTTTKLNVSYREAYSGV